MSMCKISRIIVKMNARLHRLIERNNYNLSSIEVIRYSQKLDKFITVYSKYILLCNSKKKESL